MNSLPKADMSRTTFLNDQFDRNMIHHGQEYD